MASIQFYCVHGGGSERWRAEDPEGGADEVILDWCTFPNVGNRGLKTSPANLYILVLFGIDVYFCRAWEEGGMGPR